MRYKHPPTEMGASGYYGGVGSKPASPFWTPGSDERAAAAEEKVPKRFRKLRLRRTKGRGSTSRIQDLAIPFVVLVASLLFLALALTMMSIGWS